MKKTIVLGASINPERVSFRAVKQLKEKGISCVAVGARSGEINGEQIYTGMPVHKEVHTVTLYIGKKNQKQFYDYILGLNPKRIIFNPGAENKELFELASTKGIEVIEGCTLVMLSMGNY